MANLPSTDLESHPTGTTGLNGIINSNWERLEAIFSPLATDPGSDIQIGWDASAKTFMVRKATETLSYAASVSISALGAMTQILNLTGDVTLTTANLEAGRKISLVIAADGSARNFTFPAGWVWIGAAAPASIAASKRGLLELTATSNADTGIIAKWTVQP